MTAAFDPYGPDYDAVVQDSIAFSGLDHALFVRAKVALLARLFARHFGVERPALLDVGCGIGLMHEGLGPITRSVAGTDVSAQSLARAGREHPQVEYRPQGDGVLPWPDDTFDVTLAVCVLHHVPPSQRAGLLTQMRRVTRPSGLVIAIEHNPLNPLTRLAVARCPFDHDAELLGARTARGLLRSAGLEDVRSRYFLVFPAVHRILSGIEERIGCLPIGAQYVAFGQVR